MLLLLLAGWMEWDLDRCYFTHVCGTSVDDIHACHAPILDTTSAADSSNEVQL